jgi:hypothetical protein
MCEQDTKKGALREYRASLVACLNEMQGAYDKAVMTLSGSALGISFVFIRDVIGPGQIIEPKFLIISWLSWAVAISSILISFFTSGKALRKAIDDTDADTIHLTFSKNWWSKATRIFNFLGGLTFLLGVFFLVIFVSLNIGR